MNLHTGKASWPLETAMRGQAAWVSRLDHADLPASIRTHARLDVLDWTGATLHGASSGSARGVRRAIMAADSQGPAAVFGTGLGAPAPAAAFANAVAAQADGFDDAYLWLPSDVPAGPVAYAPCHPGAAVLAAVLAVAESRPVNGRDVLVAHIAGVETACRVRRLLAGQPRGWGRPLPCDGAEAALGAAAGVSRLLGASGRRTAAALELAATLAAGPSLAPTTATAGLDAGRAAYGGVLAALLARDDACGASATVTGLDVVTGEHGLRAGIGGRWEMNALVMRPLPVSEVIAPVVDAASGLAPAAGEADRVRAIEIELPGRVLGLCDVREPRDPSQARCSVRRLVAMALLGDDLYERGALAPARYGRPQVTALCSRTLVRARRDLVPGSGVVRVCGADGSVRSVAAGLGASAQGGGGVRDRVVAKFERLARPVLGDDTTASAIEAADGLNTPDGLGELLWVLNQPLALDGTAPAPDGGPAQRCTVRPARREPVVRDR
ncbi:MmgE/PrpD family protein [Streptomyces sp. cg36]|uniref:MmgE/PrpD family protein n=1 Tax=Streptomyces sp. cg36 TaxID=3238798 RepID=UPI0034E19A27